MQQDLLKLEYFTTNLGFKAVVAGGLTGSSWLAGFCAGFGGCTYVSWMPDLILILFGMVVLDMLTGVLKASINKSLWSRIMGEGMRRKIATFAVVAGSIFIDAAISTQFDTHGFIAKWTTSWFIAVEALSLYENAQAMGVKIPGFLKEATEAFKNRLGRGKAGDSK